MLGDYDFLRGHALPFPSASAPRRRPRRKRKDDGNGEFGSILEEAAPAYGAGDQTTANLSPAARAYLATLGINNPDADAETAALLWFHALAIGYCARLPGRKRRRHPPGLAAHSAAQLESRAARVRGTGPQVAALLDTETPVPGVTTGKLRPELRPSPNCTSPVRRIFALPPAGATRGKEGVTMPGKGKMLTRAYRPEEQPEKALARTCWANPRTTFTSTTPPIGATCRRRSGTSPSAATR